MKRKVDSSVWRKFDMDNSYNWLWSPSVGRSGGILCGIKSSRFNIKSFSVGRFFVKARVCDLKFQKEYWLIVVYGAAQDEDKDLFLQNFSDICENLDIPSLIGGDFNILRFAAEKNKGGGITRFSDEFNSIITKFALRELPLSGGMFTWSNNQENPTLEKLDRILINHEWENIFPLSSARKIPRVMSDHNPIIMDTKESVEVRSREFRFEKSWFLQPDFQLRVDKAWKTPMRGSDSISVVQEKLRNVKTSLKGWGANVRGESLKIKRDLLSELENLENLEEDNVLPGPLFARKGEIQFKLMKIYEEEELYWFSRSSEKWLLEGDNNTAYFHRVANGRRRKNTMYSLKKDDIHIQGTADLLTHATEYYKMLFGPGEGNLMQLADSVWSVQEKLSDEDNIKLTEPFSEEDNIKVVCTAVT
jgi:hypothetical protein